MDGTKLGKPRLEGLQCLRGIAALAVLFQHATFFACLAKGLDYLPYLRIDFGRAGVQIFFVLSGFVMAGCLGQGKNFLLNRVIRIYPGFWLSIAVSYLLLSGPTFGWQWSWEAFTLLPTALNNSYRIPYWTLVYEMGFYVLVYILVLLRLSASALVKFCIAWLATVVLIAKYTNIPIAEPGAWLLLAHSNIFFILGLLLGLTHNRLQGLSSLPLAVGSIVFWCLGDGIAASSTLASTACFAVAYSGLLLLCVRHLRSRPLEKIGDVSYGLYLMHMPVIALTVHVVTAYLPDLGLFPLWFIVMVTGGLGGVAFGKVEYKLHVQLKRRMAARRPLLAPMPR